MPLFFDPQRWLFKRARIHLVEKAVLYAWFVVDVEDGCVLRGHTSRQAAIADMPHMPMKTKVYSRGHILRYLMGA